MRAFPSRLHRPVLLLACVMPAFFTAVGCGQKRVVVSGSVSYKGSPLSEGIVRIYSTDNHVSMANIRPDGAFAVSDVFPGEVQVTVESHPGSLMQERMSRGSTAPGEPPAMFPDKPEATPIPSKYKDRATSGLVYTITSDSEKLDIRLDEN